MSDLASTIVTIIVTLLGSAGFWAWIDKKSARTRLLVGIAHDRIIWLGMKYIERGWLTNDEYENLNDYLYEPYAAAGGNGSAARVMQEVRKLPLRKEGGLSRNE